MKQDVRLSNQIQGWLQKYFLNTLIINKDGDSISGLMVFEHAPLPQDIIRIGVGGINEIWRIVKVRAAGIKRAMTLIEAPRDRFRIWLVLETTKGSSGNEKVNQESTREVL